MAIAMNDQDNLDVILRLDSSNRDVEIPDDILIASYSNLVDKGRTSINNPFTNNHKVQTSPPNKAQSVLSVVEKAINEGRIEITNGSFIATNYKLLVSDNNTVVTSRHIGSDPVAIVSGGSDEIVTITFPSTCIPISVQVIGPSSSVDGSNNRTVIFNGSGLPGNTSITELYLPNIEKANITFSSITPSTSNPYTIDKDNSPAIQVVGVGSLSSPSISIRFVNIGSFNEKHLLKFNW